MVMTTNQVNMLAYGQAARSFGRRKRSLALNAKDREAFERAKQTGYLVHRGAGNLTDVWWYWCSATEQPYAEIELQRGGCFALVGFELMKPDMVLSEVGKQALLDELYAVSRWVRISYGCCAGSHQRVPVEQAETLARRLLDIATTHVQHRDQALTEQASAAKGEQPWTRVGEREYDVLNEEAR